MKIPAAKAAVDKDWRNWKRFRRGTWRKSEEKKEVIDEARTKGAKVHFASLMDICHLKNTELETKASKIQRSSCTPRRFCERWFWILCSIYWTKIISITNDGSKSHGYHIQIARVRRKKAADAVSAYTQLKKEDAPKLLKIPECPDIWIHLPRHKWPKSWSIMEDPVVPLERNLYGHPLAGLLWERQFEKILLKYDWEKVSNWECLVVHREKRLFLSVYVDDIELAGKKQNIDPKWKVLNKEVGLGEPTSFLDHVYLGCTQRQCEICKDIVDSYRTMFESRISAGATEKLPCSENLRISSWSYDMEGHAKKCVERYCELANKTTQQLYKVSTPSIDDGHFKEEELKSVGELSKVSSQIVLKCLYLARIGRLDILCSVNELARSITKWTKTCDKRLCRLISYIHHTCEYKQYCCHVGNTAKTKQTGTVSRLRFLQEILRIQHLHQVEHCAFWEVIHLFQTVGCVRNKLQFRTVQQSQKSFLSVQDWGWMVSPHLLCEIWSSQFFTETRIRVIKHEETRARTYVRFVQHLTSFKRERSLMDWLMI